MASISKTDNNNVVPLQSVAAGAQVITNVAVTSKLGIYLGFRFGRQNTGSLTAGANIRIDILMNGSTVPIVGFLKYTTGFAACNEEPITTNASAAQNVLIMTTTGSLAIGNIVFINNSTIANAEFAVIAKVTANTSITLERNIANAQASTTQVFNSAEEWGWYIDTTAIKNISIVYDATGCTQATAFDCWAVTGDSIA